MPERTLMQDDLDPRCVWVTSEPEDSEQRRCMRPAKWVYLKKVSPSGRLPHVETYTMCGKHASEPNRERAKAMGYTVREVRPNEPNTPTS